VTVQVVRIDEDQGAVQTAAEDVERCVVHHIRTLPLRVTCAAVHVSPAVDVTPCRIVNELAERVARGVAWRGVVCSSPRQRFFRGIRMRKRFRLGIYVGKIVRFFRKVLAVRRLQITVVLSRLARVVEVKEDQVCASARI
jgi:hypothetical protein